MVMIIGKTNKWNRNNGRSRKTKKPMKKHTTQEIRKNNAKKKI